MKHKLKLSLYIILSLTIMVIIFKLSAQSATESQALSNDLAARLVRMIGRFSPTAARILGDGESIRTLAHGFEFMCLGVSLTLLLHELLPGNKYFPLISALSGLIYALSDEVHQIFVPGRAFQISDIAVDFTGCIVGTAAATLLIKLFDKNGASADGQE